jgi:type IV pilus assembly protein PilZ
VLLLIGPSVPTFVEVDWRSEGTFLFAPIGEARSGSPLGIFVRTDDPLPQGTRLQLHFAALAGAGFELLGEVVWTTRAPERTGMGVRLHSVGPRDQARLLELVRTIAYVDARSAN